MWADSMEVKTVILNDLGRLAALNRVAPYEVIKGVIIDTETWTPENGRMTASRKLCRYASSLSLSLSCFLSLAHTTTTHALMHTHTTTLIFFAGLC